MKTDDLIITGLPSEGSRQLISCLRARQSQHTELNAALENPLKLVDFTESWLEEHLFEVFDSAPSRTLLIVYQSPWRFLKYQLTQAGVFLGKKTSLRHFATNTLRFWHSYHSSLFQYFCQFRHSCLLLNGDYAIDLEFLHQTIQARFDILTSPLVNEGNTNDVNLNNQEIKYLRPIIQSLAPECLELFASLESSADLMGRRPELEFDGPSEREGYLTEILELVTCQAIIKRLLNLETTNPSEIETKLATILESHNKLTALDTEKNQQLANLKDELETRKTETEQCLLEIKRLKIEHEQIFTYKQSCQKMLEAASDTPGNLDEMIGHLIQERDQNKRSFDELRDKADKSQNEIDNLIKENELYLVQLHQLQEDLEHRVELNHQFQQQLTEMRHRDETNFSSRRGWKEWLSPFYRRNRVIRQQAAKIKASGLFDEEWYIKTYPDVAEANMEPIVHYLRYGVLEGRNPNSNFDTLWYLKTYPDVAHAEVNPFVHYIEFGRIEGRQPTRLMA